MTGPETSLARHLGVLSLERWDDTWRRNQHLASQLVEQGIVERLTFVEPAEWLPPLTRHPAAGITTIRPRLMVPKRTAGLRLLATALLRGPLRDVDLLWINDAVLGRWLVQPNQRAFYDVTDDWRTATSPHRVRRRQIAAEDRLSTNVATLVCSQELARRWLERYGAEPAVIPNGVDLGLWKHVVPIALTGPSPHFGYVGTLHAQRLDIDLIVELARSAAVGTVYLVGPDVLDPASRSRLDAAGVRRVGPIPHTEVPSWMRAFDVLICPHLVSAFTLSLDAIKSYEYAQAGKPVIATPTSGFQAIACRTWSPTDRSSFVARAAAVVTAHEGSSGLPAAVGWDERARTLDSVLRTMELSRPR